jgi:methionyl-tRNA formyltransferase
MRVVFAGTPPFAAVALHALVDAGHELVLVLTQPDRPAGRGMRLTPSAVKQAAQARALPIAQPPTLREPAVQEQLAASHAEVMVVAAYGLLLPPAVLALPVHGCLNIHASLLPRWRGAAPIQRALLAGDSETGVCIMQMEAGLDTGPVWLHRTTPIGARDTAGSLLERLSVLGAQAIVDALSRLDRLPPPKPQSAQGVTYAAKIDKREAAIDFTHDAAAIDRQVRAFDPAPGAFCVWQEQTLKVWRAHPGNAVPNPPRPTPGGTVLALDVENGIEVACGGGTLWLDEVQRAGGRRQPAIEFAQSQRLQPGMRLHPAARD